MPCDAACWVGAYPYRHLPETDVAAVLGAFDRIGISAGWVGALPAAWHRDPGPANEWLLATVATHRDRLLPVLTVRPDLPGWVTDLQQASDLPSGAVRTYPMQAGLDPQGESMRRLVAEAGALGMAVVLTTRFEDARQRQTPDVVSDLPASAVRQLARVSEHGRLVVTHAGRDFIEEVHYGLTDTEAARVSWDISCIWGPPANDLEHLVRTVGSDRLLFGTGFPLRIPESPVANLDLLALFPDDRAAIEHGNFLKLARR